MQGSPAHLKQLLQSCSGKAVFVRPVLLYPGWWVDENADAQVWVLNPDRLPVWLKRAPVKLDKDEIHHLVSNLRRQLSGT